MVVEVLRRLVNFCFPQNSFTRKRTFGRLTFGIMTEWSADGASLVLVISPPGWYWYLPIVPEFHGSEPAAIETGCSEEADVGLRAMSYMY